MTKNSPCNLRRVPSFTFFIKTSKYIKCIKNIIYLITLYILDATFADSIADNISVGMNIITADFKRLKSTTSLPSTFVIIKYRYINPIK